MKVIVALDLTGYSKQIVDKISSRKWPRDTAFKLLTVLEPVHWEHHSSAELQKAASELSKRRKQIAYDVLADAKKTLESTVSQCSVHVEIRNGSPRTEILNAAVDWMPDRIVLGAHGQAPNRFFAGSTARAVAQHAPCSVELVRLSEREYLEQTARMASENSVSV